MVAAVAAVANNGHVDAIAVGAAHKVGLAAKHNAKTAAPAGTYLAAIGNVFVGGWLTNDAHGVEAVLRLALQIIFTFYCYNFRRVGKVEVVLVAAIGKRLRAVASKVLIPKPANNQHNQNADGSK